MMYTEDFTKCFSILLESRLGGAIDVTKQNEKRKVRDSLETILNELDKAAAEEKIEKAGYKKSLKGDQEEMFNEN